jgi:hypothetical protein
VGERVREILGLLIGAMEGHHCVLEQPDLVRTDALVRRLAQVVDQRGRDERRS